MSFYFGRFYRFTNGAARFLDITASKQYNCYVITF
nr:MAG TPA: hypothetical protein [Caudoviricetes sp.]